MRKIKSMNSGYMDPQPIAQINFNYPRRWKLDGKELAAGETVEEKEKIRMARIKEEGLKIAAWMAIYLKNLQHFETIWIPYHFK
jgi:hypothetical protein